ncbi:MAG: tRNA pseudouridine(55) synthase TruB [Patescibacteria group bacterium]
MSAEEKITKSERYQLSAKSVPRDILLIDKPKGITSFGVIRILRRKLGVKKMGHVGTLDPLATGLLLIGVGADTKQLYKLLGLPKTYFVEVFFGCRTTTGDMEGKILEQKTITELDEKKLELAIKQLVGVLKLSVPIYSAVKQKGVPLYKKARQGKTVIPPIREMKVFRARLLKHNKKDKGYIAHLEINVASGVYIRSVVEELGRILDVPAVVKELRRTQIGEFDIKNAQQL